VIRAALIALLLASCAELAPDEVPDCTDVTVSRQPGPNRARECSIAPQGGFPTPTH
jgi:hypothetical protein